jgi:hypothetical protein
MGSTYIDPNPKIWGPILWRKLHTITFKYPNVIDTKNPSDMKIQKRVRKLFMDLKSTIPCKACRDSYRKYIQELPIDDNLDSREKLSYWLYIIHNKVNAKLRRQESEDFRKALYQLEEYARVRRVSPEQFEHMKNKLKYQIMITGPDPSFHDIKQKYKYAKLG